MVSLHTSLSPSFPEHSKLCMFLRDTLTWKHSFLLLVSTRPKSSRSNTPGVNPSDLNYNSLPFDRSPEFPQYTNAKVKILPRKVKFHLLSKFLISHLQSIDNISLIFFCHRTWCHHRHLYLSLVVLQLKPYLSVPLNFCRVTVHITDPKHCTFWSMVKNFVLWTLHVRNPFPRILVESYTFQILQCTQTSSHFRPDLFTWTLNIVGENT